MNHKAGYKIYSITIRLGFRTRVEKITMESLQIFIRSSKYCIWCYHCRQCILTSQINSSSSMYTDFANEVSWLFVVLTKSECYF